MKPRWIPNWPGCRWWKWAFRWLAHAHDRAAYDELVREAPDVAVAQVADSKFDKACSALARALEIDPGYVEALTLRDRVCVANPVNTSPSATQPVAPDPSAHP